MRSLPFSSLVVFVSTFAITACGGDTTTSSTAPPTAGGGGAYAGATGGASASGHAGATMVGGAGSGGATAGSSAGGGSAGHGGSPSGAGGASAGHAGAPIGGSGGANAAGSAGGPAGSGGACAATFPTFDASCAAASDCAVGIHQTDCCGNHYAEGINQSQVSAFAAAEPPWDACFPGCGCAGGGAKCDDGNTTFDESLIGVTCDASGTCKTFVSGAGGSGGAGGAGGNSGGSGGAPSCAIDCQPGMTCCGDVCVNPNNDIFNCGGCGVPCGGPSPYCDNGTCGTPPCTAPDGCSAPSSCCGSSCCGAGQLCCNVPGPVVGIGPACTMPTESGTCPTGCTACVCASPDTPIATPTGPKPIADLEVGDLVYSVDNGALVIVPIGQIGRRRAEHHVVRRITLASGQTLSISGPHPTADGRIFAQLEAGATLDGVTIVDAQTVPYAHAFTYDILPLSDSGAYFAADVLIGSTLAREPALVSATITTR